MKGGTQAAVAIGVGYVLGRRRKMRKAALIAAATATGGIGGLGSAALRRGAKVLGSTEMLGKVAPQVGELADTVRGDLVGAGKAAAKAAVTGRIESLTDSLQQRAETIRDPAAATAAAGETVKGAGRRGRRVLGGENGDAPEDEETEAEYDDEPDDDDAETGEPQPRRRTARGKSPVARTRR